MFAGLFVGVFGCFFLLVGLYGYMIARLYVYMYVCMYACMHVCMYVCVYVYMRRDVP